MASNVFNAVVISVKKIVRPLIWNTEEVRNYNVAEAFLYFYSFGITYLSFWYISTEEFSSDNFSFNSCKFELTKLSSSATVSFSFRFVVACR